MQDVFIDFVRSEKEHGKTILLSSHIFTEVDATCDRIAIIKDGRIVNDFVADDLRHATQKKYTVTFSDEAVKDRFLCDVERCAFLHILTQQASSVTFQTEDRDINQVIAKLSGYPVVNFSHEKQTLEDYFMKYYKEEKDFEGALSQ
jgi:ABC-2 type transport system ATP-binding protein